MNWIFIDRHTYQMRFGVRAVSDGHLTGPWDCTRQEKRLTFAGWEGFCAVLEEGGIWGLYFDHDDDALRAKLGPDRVVIEIELQRREMRTRKPPMRAQLPAAPDLKPAPPAPAGAAAADRVQAEAKPRNTAGNVSTTTKPSPVARDMVEKIQTEIDSEGGSTRVGTPSEGSRVHSPTGSPSSQGQSEPEDKEAIRPLNLKYKQPSVENSDED